MSRWIEEYVQQTTATHKRHILLQDRDGLMAHPELCWAFEQRGYALFSGDTHWKVRVEYELRIRDSTHPIILLVPVGYKPLPDMAATTHSVEVGLRELFPFLDASVLQGLSAPDLTTLSAVRHYHRLERDATLNWLLEHLYTIDADSLKISPTRNRVARAMQQVYEHPTPPNPAVNAYIETLSAPYRVAFDELLKQITGWLDKPAVTPDAWFEQISVLSQAIRWAMTWPGNTFIGRLTGVVTLLNNQFQSYLDQHYESLFSLSAVKRPAVVSRVLDHLRAQSDQKIALIVIDGMNVWQGQLLTEALTASSLRPIAGATMAYIPTITAWSRQALFRGNRPDLTTDNRKEGNGFKDYWTNTGLQPNQVLYDTFSNAAPFAVSALPATVTRLGLVCNDLDNLMHGMLLGNDQLEQVTQQWIKTGPMLPLLASLKQAGFTCYLTADHGNLEATGIKNLKLTEKTGALSRSKRHIQFLNTVLRDSFVEQNPQLSLGIRDRSVYLRDTSAFTTKSQTVVTHGGSHFWEVIVPFIKL